MKNMVSILSSPGSSLRLLGTDTSFGLPDTSPKLFWQHRDSYASTPRPEVRKISECAIDSRCSISLTVDGPKVSTSLSRACTTGCTPPAIKNQDMRSIHLVLTRQYLPLQFIDTPDELQQVFCGAVTGHHQAWRQTDILRCEIRISNIVFHRTPTGIVGVFCDLDIPDDIEEVLQVGQEEPLTVNQSQHERSEKTVREEEADEFQVRLIDDQSDSKYKRKYLTGMVPFMALDLLAPVPAPTHLYRHDLESFFWVLTYFVATHDPDRHALRCIISWMDTNPQRICRSKTQFLTDMSYREGILNRKDPQYEGFVDKVLLRLYILFKIVEIKRRTLTISHVGYWKSLARQNELAQAYYAKDIERISKSRNRLVPFNQFVGDLNSQRELHPYDIMAIDCYS